MDFPRLLTVLAACGALVACSPEPTAGTSPQRSNGSAGADDVPATTDPTAQTRPPGKIARAADDAALTTRVKAALVADESTKAGDISVSSSGGQVTLSGSVPAEQIMRADAIARGVDGVTEVINSLTPLEPLTTPPS